jgi:3-phenylpropionate/trans-cinnamate dioxygenase ferredoxin reductase subunit
VEQAVTANGREIDCDFVVVGIGALPNTELAEKAGLWVENGIVTNQELRTSDDNIFSAGDVANSYNTRYGQNIRVEHWSNALHGGPAAAQAMLGHTVDYNRIPYFYSDQYDSGMEYSGYAASWDQVIIRGDMSAGEFLAFWIEQDKVVAGMNINIWDVHDQIRALIDQDQTVSLQELADPNTPLEQLIQVNA